MAKKVTKAIQAPLKITPTSETYVISIGEFEAEVYISPQYIHIGPKQGFVFRSANKKETIKRWQNVIAILSASVDLLKDKTDYGKK